jgi:hypothetical protein
MSDTHVSNSGDDEPQCYEIRLKGHLGDRWGSWFGGLDITLEENGDTLMIGPVVDQAALFGLLRKVRDVGMPLVSVNRVTAGQASRSDDESEGKQSKVNPKGEDS